MNPEDLSSSTREDDAQFAAWSTMAEEVPFAGRPAPQTERQESHEEDLRELRTKHIMWLERRYEPTQAEFDAMSDDEDFYDSPQYKFYRREKCINSSIEHPDVYYPTERKVKATIKPYAEKVSQSMPEIVNKMESVGENFDVAVTNAIITVARSLGVNIDNMQLVFKDFNPDNPNLGGSYNRIENRLTIIRPEQINLTSIADTVDSVAHELFHAHQSEEEEAGTQQGELYKINHDNYVSSSIDYDMYRSQIVEQEAFAFGGQIGNKFREEYLRKHPELIHDLRKKYSLWLRDKYSPSKAKDGYDCDFLIAAEKIWKERTAFGRTVKFAKDCFKKWRKNR